LRPGFGPLSACFLALLAASGASCDGSRGEAASQLGGADDGEETKVLVKLGEFVRGDISSKLRVSADLDAVAKADVFPEIPGVIREVLHREGDRVEKGEPVVRLVDESLKLAVDTKRILADQAKTKVALADVAKREGEEIVRQKDLLKKKATDEYERIRQLAEEGGGGLISREEADTKRYAFEQASIDYATALLQKEKYALEHSQTVESEKLAQVELKTAEYNLSQTVLRSPISGAMSYLLVKPGEMVSVSTRVFTVVQVENLEARLHAPQYELARIRPGLEVQITCDVFPDKGFQGHIEVVNPVVDKVEGTVQVLVGISDPLGFLKPGLFISGEILLDTRRNAVLVPKKAVSYVNEEPVIFLVKDGVAHSYVVRRGYSDRDTIEVLGLTAMDGSSGDPADGSLVLVGHNNLKEGSKVEVE
jgi:multidrug efflux pump subunit AcrA (membrane-fusion protein)